jgi:hypothetical protein
MAEIKATLEDEVKISELIDSLLERWKPQTKCYPESMVYDFNKTAKSNSIDTTIGIKAAFLI